MPAAIATVLSGVAWADGASSLYLAFVTALLVSLAVVMALFAIVKAPVFASVASPLSATEVATLEPFPTKRFPLVRAASFEKAIAALAATSLSLMFRAANFDFAIAAVGAISALTISPSVIIALVMLLAWPSLT